MAISPTDKEFIKYFTLLNEQQKQSLLGVVKSFLGKEKPEISTISIEQYNKELDEALERISNGEFTSFEALEDEMKSW